MRFEPRFSNGFWGVFDTHDYRILYRVLTQGRAIEDAIEANLSELQVNLQVKR